MSDTSAKDDIAELMKRLTEPVEAATDGESQAMVRLLVATDWADASVPLTLLKAFRVIVPPKSPVQLVFAVPHEPTIVDAECVSVLTAGVSDEGNLAGLDIVSFAQAVEEPYDAAVVPVGRPNELIAEVGGLVVRMHDLMRRLDLAGTASADPTLNVGDQAMLRRRLSSFVG